MDLSGKKVAVLGLGRSGASAARLAVRRGATVSATDQKAEGDLPFARELASLGVSLHLGKNDPAVLESADLLVVSPGVPDNDVTKTAEARSLPVVSEVEMASWWIEAPIVAITGTNGKSTVTTLIGEMLRASGIPTFVGGNLGTPLSDAVGTEAASVGRVVCELSSYQLERIERFRAYVGVLLNVTPDHLDRYPSFDAYAAAKGNLFAHQAAGAHAVIPAGDAVCARQAARGPALAHTFGASPSATIEIGADAIVDHGSGASYPVSEIRIRGGHNLQNAAASILAARLAGAHPDSIRGTLSAFDGLPHRMRLVATIDSVEYYDDSKATNVAAAVAAIEGLGKRVVLIAGGVDKGGGYAPLVAALRAQGRAVVTLGSAASLIEGAIGDTLPTQRVGSMAQAVRAARRLARPGDAVLLAPACASFDMFANYAERGDVFAAAVRELAAGGAG